MNGSGKSAFLTALTVGLGGRASNTNRANSIKGLIKAGESAAEIQINILNADPTTAFKYELYGDVVSVVRRINKDGSSSYKLKGSNYYVCSRRDELSQLLDHYSLQPDNPMLILSQDNAKAFLTSSTPEERYRLFLRGTQLDKLKQDYNEAERYLVQMESDTREQSDDLKELKLQRDKAVGRVQKVKHSEEMHERVVRLESDVVWVQYYDVVDECDKSGDGIVRLEGMVEQCEGEIEKVGDSDSDSAISELRLKLEEINTRQDSINSQIDDKLDYIKSNSRMAQLKSTFNELRSSLERRKSEIGVLRERLGQLERSNSGKGGDSDSSSKLEELKRRLAECEGEIDRLEYSVSSNSSTITTTTTSLKSQINVIQSQIDQLSSQLNSSYLVDARILDGINRDIRSTKFHSSTPPLGPIGNYLTLDRDEWTIAIDGAINPLVLYGYIVADSRDVAILSRIFEKNRYLNNGRIFDIFVCREDHEIFRIDDGNINRNYLRILDVFKFKSNLVRQLFINQYQIESTLLVEDRSSVPTTGDAYKVFDKNANRIINKGSRGSANLNYRRNIAPAGMSFSRLSVRKDEIIRSEIEVKKRDCERLRGEIVKSEEEERRVRSEERRNRARLDELMKERAELRRVVLRLEEEIDRNRSANNADEDIIEHLKDEIRRAEGDIETIKSQIPDLVEEIKREKDKDLERQNEIEELRRVSDEQRVEYDAIVEQLKQLEIERRRVAGKVEYYEKKRDEYQRELEMCREENERLRAKRDDFYAKAMEFTDQREIKRSELSFKTRERIEKEIRNIKAVIEQQSQMYGSLEDATLDMLEKQRRFERLRSELKSQLDLIEEIRCSIEERKRSWRVFRKSIAHRAKKHFIGYLSYRNYEGVLDFDHKDEKLYVRVKTMRGEDVSLTQQPQTQQVHSNSADSGKVSRGGLKEARNLSGGEKSFSTVCLLLSLWESMSCRIRGLDEFDVYMDQVNRRVAMQLLMDAARRSKDTQFILISPQAIQNVGKGVHVVRMVDPRSSGQRSIDEYFVSNK